MRHLVLGTAGHIDHGKTALVHALTGVDTDRLPEEKARGITIDIGFAALQLDGLEVGVVDVPGHEAFVRNMLAGATGIDLVLLVVAADEGVMPQTREHLDIVHLLDIRHGVVAVTKSDLVDAEWLDLVLADVAETLLGTPLQDAPVLPVSARTGQGLETLRDEIARVAARVPMRAADDLLRIPLDRAFTIRGTGTVVTGTVWSGELSVGDNVTLVPNGRSARVRGLQQHGRAVERVGAGARAAIALAGLDREHVARGDVLVSDGGWSPAGIMTVELAVLPGASAVRHRQRVRVHLGTAEVLGRVATFQDDVPPGGTALVQLRLEQPVTTRAGDRLVIRSYSPVATIAGAIVVEPDAPRRRRLDADTARLLRALAGGTAAPGRIEAAVALRGRLRLKELPVATGLSPAAIEGALATPTGCGVYRSGDLILPLHVVERVRTALLGALARHHVARPLDDGLDRDAALAACDAPADVFDVVVRESVAAGETRTLGGAIALATHEPRVSGASAELMEALMAVYRETGLQAPDSGSMPSELSRHPDILAVHRYLERSRQLVRLGPTQWVDAGALADAVAAVRHHAVDARPLTVADFRDILGLTRRHLIPLLEYLDASGVTLRQGDLRAVAGVQPEAEPSRERAVASPDPTQMQS